MNTPRRFSAERGDYNTATDLGFRHENGGYCSERIFDSDDAAEVARKLERFTHRVRQIVGKPDQ